MSTQPDTPDAEMEMRTACCTARTELVERKGHTYLECSECGQSSPKRERVTLEEAQAAHVARHK